MDDSFGVMANTWQTSGSESPETPQKATVTELAAVQGNAKSEKSDGSAEEASSVLQNNRGLKVRVLPALGLDPSGKREQHGRHNGSAEVNAPRAG